MSKTLIVYASNMPCEVGMAAFLVSLSKTVEAKGLTTKESESVELVRSCIQQNPPYTKIIFIGTYCASSLSIELKSRNSLPEVGSLLMYCPSKVPENVFYGCVKLVDGTAFPPIEFLRGISKELGLQGAVFDYFFSSHATVLKMIEDRLFNREIMENQIFYTGIFNYGDANQTLFSKFIDYFEGKVDFKHIMSTGATILSSQLNVVKERVKNNSRMIQLHDGTYAVMTTAPELVNLTHTALHEKYPNMKMTLIVDIKFSKDDKPPSDSNQDELALSLRSYDASIDARELAVRAKERGFKGDGNAVAAGGRIPMSFKVPL